MALKSYESYSDGTLASMSIDGDIDAFGILFSRHRDSLRESLSSRVTGSIIDIDDILQETFIKSLAAIRTFDTTRSFEGWAYTIAYRTFLDSRRTSHPANELPRDAEYNAPNPEENVISTQQQAQIERYIARLDENYRLIFELRFIEEYSYEEIAERLGMKLNTVKTRIARVRKQMRDMIVDGNCIGPVLRDR